MSASQRTKGAAGERELCGLIMDKMGVRLVRNLEQSRRGGHDIVPADDASGPVAVAFTRLAIEVKRRSCVSQGMVKPWWDQAKTQAESAGLVPVLAYRADRYEWRFMVPLFVINPALTRDNGIEYTAELSLHGFCAIMREADFL